jgi:hypothetical protein
MENTHTSATSVRNTKSKSSVRNPKSVLEMEVWKKLDGEDLWLGPKGVMVNSAALEERKFFYNIVQVS